MRQETRYQGMMALPWFISCLFFCTVLYCTTFYIHSLSIDQWESVGVDGVGVSDSLE